MADHVHKASELDTINHDSDALVGRLFITIKTGDRKNAGTDAKVTLRIGQNLKLQLDSLGDIGQDPFERGKTNKFMYQINEAVDGYISLHSVRDSLIKLYHDNTGNKPGWYVESLLLQLSFVPDMNEFFDYKKWENIGWLAMDEAPNTTSVILL